MSTRGHRFRRLITRALREQKGALALAALGMAGAVVAELLAPWPLKVIFDQILLGKPVAPALAPLLQPLLALGVWTALLAMAGAIAAVAVASGAASYLQLYMSARVGHRITWALRAELFAHLQRLSLAYHRSNRAGEMITKVAGDTNLLRDLFADWALTLARHTLTLITMLVVMFWLNWQLAVVVSLTLPPLLGAIFVLNRRVKASAREQRRHEGQMTSRLNEVLSSIALVQAFGRGGYEEERFSAAIRRNYESGMKAARVGGAIVRAIAILSAVGTATVVLLGAREVLGGRLTPGELLIFVAYVSSLYKPVKDIGRLTTKLSRASVSAQRVAEILDAEPDADDPPDALELAHCGGEIVFEHVSFAYADGRPVFEDLNLRIAPGERVALVGPSGAGKSTLVALLLRLYEPSAGRILVDGIDIRRLRRDSLRAAIGVVPQDNLLFGVSVRENIVYGRPDATPEMVEAAARHARAHEFIVDLPQGYDTEIGERGATLSGGQRQRLCLARALVKTPAMLVMDEPTAAIDAASARLIHEAVARVHAGRTLIVITHDLGGLDRYDRVITLEHGRVSERSSAPAAPPRSPLSIVESRRA